MTYKIINANIDTDNGRASIVLSASNATGSQDYITLSFAIAATSDTAEVRIQALEAAKHAMWQGVKALDAVGL